MSRAFKHAWTAHLTAPGSKATSTQRLVGLLLADYMHADSSTAWPSIATIAERTALSPRAVQNALRGLLDHQLLVVAREGKGSSVHYQAVLPDDPTPAPRADPPRHDVPTQRYEPRHLTTPTSAPRSETSAPRAPEALRSWNEPEGAPPPALALVGSPPADAALTRCPFCDVVLGIEQDDVEDDATIAEHVELEHKPDVAHAVKGLSCLPADTTGDGRPGCWRCERVVETYLYDEEWLCAGCVTVMRPGVAA